MWKGYVQHCLDHLCSKHDGTRFLDLKTLEKFFPPWTVSREFWRAALGPGVSGIANDVKLFPESG